MLDGIPLFSFVELNINELCNRTCVFCPRVDPEIYPNRNLNMEPELVSRLIDEVERMGLSCRFSFSGYGEPLLHKRFPEMIRQIRQANMKRCRRRRQRRMKKARKNAQKKRQRMKKKNKKKENNT